MVKWLSDSSIVVNNFGLYNVTVTDANNCQDSITAINIIQPLQLVLSLDSLSDVSCFGSQDGFASVISTGGTGGIQYIWSTGDSTILTDSLSGGFYFISATDSVGCTSTLDSILINEQTALLVNQIHCILVLRSSIRFLSSLQVELLPIYVFNGMTTSSISNVPTGIITNRDGCRLCVNDSQVSITEPSQLNFTVDSISNITCFGNRDGFVLYKPLGNTSIFIYLTTGDTTTTIDSLSQGIYAVTIVDANGCVDSIDSIVINEPTILQVTVDSIAMNACFGDDQGFISVMFGGTTISYQWSSGLSTQFVDSLSGGVYADHH